MVRPISCLCGMAFGSGSAADVIGHIESDNCEALSAHHLLHVFNAVEVISPSILPPYGGELYTQFQETIDRWAIAAQSSGKAVFTCKADGEQFGDSNALEQHLKGPCNKYVGSNHGCENCMEGFKCPSMLVKHLETFHSAVITNDLPSMINEEQHRGSLPTRRSKNSNKRNKRASQRKERVIRGALEEGAGEGSSNPAQIMNNTQKGQTTVRDQLNSAIHEAKAEESHDHQAGPSKPKSAVELYGTQDVRNLPLGNEYVRNRAQARGPKATAPPPKFVHESYHRVPHQLYDSQPSSEFIWGATHPQQQILPSVGSTHGLQMYQSGQNVIPQYNYPPEAQQGLTRAFGHTGSQQSQFASSSQYETQADMSHNSGVHHGLDSRDPNSPYNYQLANYIQLLKKGSSKDQK